MSSSHTYKSRNSGGTLTTAASCYDCHPGSSKGAQHAKSSDTNVIAIPNNTAVGLNYGHLVDTGINGFVLGGNVTSGTSEADICWNCHAQANTTSPNGQEVSEWGTNTNTNGTLAKNYNFGTLSTKSWFTGTWSSANFKYKVGALTSKPTLPKATPGSAANGGSTHSANAAGAAGVDTVDKIRCSYCHNVHLGTNGNGSTAGRPFLRNGGTWKGNPYREDGAPRWDTGGDQRTFSNFGNFGNVPRGTTQYTMYGGYQIDQNNGSPTTGWTVTNSAGLCTMCHSTVLSAGFGTVTEWASGQNSHMAVVLTAPGGPYFNLMSEDRRHNSVGYPSVAGTTNRVYTTAPWMATKHSPTAGYTFRGTSGFKFLPVLPNGAPRSAGQYNWGATIDRTTVNNNYHKYSCSKCHTPHASRLPRLLITNCLDTAVNTWEDQAGFVSTPASGYSAENSSVKASNLTTAQNCHRRRAPIFNKSWTTNPAGATPVGQVPDGWNKVSPW
jgi:hypothetical protein